MSVDKQILDDLALLESEYEIIVERLGKYHRTLSAGFHLTLPFFDNKVVT